MLPVTLNEHANVCWAPKDCECLDGRPSDARDSIAIVTAFFDIERGNWRFDLRFRSRTVGTGGRVQDMREPANAG